MHKAGVCGDAGQVHCNRNSINREYCRNCLLNPACKERYGSGIVDFCEIKEE